MLFHGEITRPIMYQVNNNYCMGCVRTSTVSDFEQKCQTFCFSSLDVKEKWRNEMALQRSWEWHAVEEVIAGHAVRGKCMLAVAEGRKGVRAMVRVKKKNNKTEPSVAIMRHRCSPWIHIPCQRGGWEGWNVVKYRTELLQDRLSATFHSDRILLLISICTPEGVHEHSAKNSGPPEDTSSLWASKLFLTLHLFTSILSV